MNKEILNKFILPALAFIAMGIISTFLFGKLDKISDTQIDILQRVTRVETDVEYVKNIVENLAETQGTVQGSTGDNAFEIRIVNRRLDNLEKRFDKIEDN